MAATLCIATGQVTLAPDIKAQIDDDALNTARDAVRRAFDPTRAGIFYAASIDFAVQPDIATANFKLNGLADQGLIDPELVNGRIPLRLGFDVGRENMRGFVQVIIGYQDLSMSIPFLGDDTVQSDWRSRGIDLGLGVEYELSDTWTLVPAVNVGVADLRNRADYGDSVLGPIFQPVFAGIVFDWDTSAWIGGASLGLRFDRQYSGFRVRSNASATANYIRSFDESSADIVIDYTASTLDLELNTLHPLGRFGETPVELVTIVGLTSLVGNARGELGFDEFVEVGLALQFDISRFKLPLESVRVGAKAITGRDVSGWSLVIGRGL